MEILFNSIRAVFYGFIILVVNIPVLLSIDRMMELIKNAAKLIGIEV